jgi:hypothetical protein
MKERGCGRKPELGAEKEVGHVFVKRPLESG